MARRKEMPLTSFSSVLMPDGTRVRTDELPPDVWAAKKKEMASAFCKAVKESLEHNPYDMKMIYDHPEFFGATIYYDSSNR